MNLEKIPYDGKEYLAFTYNPCDARQFWKANNRFIEVYNDVFNLFNTYLYGCEWELYPEYSFSGNSVNLATGPRIHFHGVIRFNKKSFAQFLEYGYYSLKIHGVFEIDTLGCDDTPENCKCKFHSKQDWIDGYCTKAPIMEYICKKNKVPYAMTNNLTKKLKGKKFVVRDDGEDENNLLDYFTSS